MTLYNVTNTSEVILPAVGTATELWIVFVALVILLLLAAVVTHDLAHRGILGVSAICIAIISAVSSVTVTDATHILANVSATEIAITPVYQVTVNAAGMGISIILVLASLALTAYLLFGGEKR